MRVTRIAYVFLVATVACAGGEQRAPADSSPAQANSRGAGGPGRGDSGAAPRRTILFVGTSLTAGLGLDPDSAYPQQIQRMIDSAGLPYEAVNAGVSGETSAALLRRLDWLLREPASLIVLETGANDGLRGIPVTTMRENIQAVVDRIRAARPDVRIALVQMESPPNLGASYTRAFRAVFPEVARKSGITLLPFLLDSVAGRRELNQGDGIHPNLAGERIVARNMWRGLRPLLQ